MNKIKLKQYRVLVIVGMLFATNSLPVSGELGDLQTQKEIILSKINAGDIVAAKSAVDGLLVSFSGHQDIVNVVDDIAGEYRSCGKYAEAVEMYKYIVTNHGDNPEAIGAQARLVKVYISLDDELAANQVSDELPAKFAGSSELSSRVCEVADCFHRFGKFEKAKQLYQRVTEMALSVEDEYAICAQKGMATAAIRLGDSAGAESAITKLKTDFAVNSRLAQALNDVAGEYRETNEFDKAGELYKYVISNWPDGEEALFAQMRLVKTYNGQGNITATDEDFNKLLRDYKNHEKIDEAACELGDYFSAHQQREKARQGYKYVVDNCSGSHYMRQALSGLAQTDIYLGDDAAAQVAIEKLKAGFASDEKIARDICRIGACYQFIGQSGKAGQLYSYILSLSDLPNVEFVRIWKQTALALSQMCQNDKAASQATLEQLCVGFPHSDKLLQALNEVAEVCYQNKDYQQAAAIWQEMLEREPEKTLDRSRFLYLKGLCNENLKECAKAIGCYTELATDDPQDFFAGRVPYQIGMLYKQLGNYNEAISWLERHYRLYPNSIFAENALFDRGLIYQFNVKDYSSAVKVFREYRDSYPARNRAALALYNMALCYEKMDDISQAVATLSEAQTQYPESVFAQDIAEEYAKLSGGAN